MSPPDLLEDMKSVQHHIKTRVLRFFSCLPWFVSSCTSSVLLYNVQYSYSGGPSPFHLAPSTQTTNLPEVETHSSPKTTENYQGAHFGICFSSLHVRNMNISFVQLKT